MRARQRWRDEPWYLTIDGSVFTFTVCRSMTQKRPVESIRRLASPRGLGNGRNRCAGLLGAFGGDARDASFCAKGLGGIVG